MSPTRNPADGEAGFLSRWSQRKTKVRAGLTPTPEPGPAPALAAIAASHPPTAAPTGAAPAPETDPQRPRGAPAEAPTRPALTLEDVSALTPQADFTRFVQPGVDGPVRNAALRKLFADPHYNVMDGLDTYIDDYGRPDPLPASMLRRMTQSGALGLFDDTDDSNASSPPAPAAPCAPDPADPGMMDDPAVPDEDPDLRLQPDDAPAGPGPEPGPGPDPGRQR